ncbi:hypothetical protein TI03_07335, partial [Achromatium sp. WMS1]
DDWMGIFLGQDPTPDLVRNPNYMSNSAVADWVLNALSFGGLGVNDKTSAPASGPAYLLFGGLDPLYPPNIRQKYLNDLKKSGVLSFDTYKDVFATHDSVLGNSASKIIKWFRSRFAAF